MNTKEDIRPVTYLKTRAADLLEQINTTHRPVIITQNGEARGILQDPESYDRMRTAIGLLKLVAQGEEDVRAGRVVDQDALFSRIEAGLKSKKD